MCQAEEDLKKFSFDQDNLSILRTPNKIQYKNHDFQAWEDLNQHPFQSPQRKMQIDKIKTTFKLKPMKFVKNSGTGNQKLSFIIQNKQNNHNGKSLRIRMSKNMSSSQQKSDNLQNEKQFEYQKYDEFVQPQFDTPNRFQTPTRRPSTQHSLKKQFQSDKIAKKSLQNNQTLKRCQKNPQVQPKFSFFNLKQQNPLPTNKQPYNLSQNSFRQQNHYKVPVMTILYPVLKKIQRRENRTIDRFHSFVARTVRK